MVRAVGQKTKGKALLIGCAAGAVNGLLGTGGGMILVPAFTGLMGLEEKKALATSVAVIAPLCLLSAGIYWLRGGLPLWQAVPYLIGGLAGGILGSAVFRWVPPVLLKRAFGALLIYGGVRSFF